MSSQPFRIAVLGLGGAGGKILSELSADDNLGAVELAVADSDLRALEKVSRVLTIPLGKDWTHTNGCGGNAVLGEKAAKASLSDLQQFIGNAQLLFVVCGLGGGTGSGGVKVLASLVRQMNVMAIFMVTLPFAFEGGHKRVRAEKDLEALRQSSSTIVIPIPNDLVFTTLQANTAVEQAFELANSRLAAALCGFSRIARADGVLAVDFAALRELLKDQPALCTLGVAEAAGPQRWEQLQKEFFACPLLGGPGAIAKADAALIMLVGGKNLNIGDMQQALSGFQQQFTARTNVLVGAYVEPQFQDEVQVTGLVCQFTPRPAAGPSGNGLLPGFGGGAEPDSGRGPGSKGGRAAKAAADRERQGTLPLQEQSLGIFSSTPPTFSGGENLDIPTFQRRGEVIDPGD